MSVSKVRIISGGFVELVGPSVDDRMLVEVFDGGHDTVLEFYFGCDADMAQDGEGQLGEEAFDQVEPGAMRWCERELEAALGLGSDPSFRLLGDMCGMIVEDPLDRRVSWISGG